MLALAVREDRILITNDTDFGERIFRSKQPHRGIILLRLADERPANKVAVLKQLLEHHAADLEGAFVVVGEASVRIVRP